MAYFTGITKQVRATCSYRHILSIDKGYEADESRGGDGTKAQRRRQDGDPIQSHWTILIQGDEQWA